MLSRLSRIVVVAVVVVAFGLLALRAVKPPPVALSRPHFHVTVPADGSVELKGVRYVAAAPLAARLALFSRMHPPPRYDIYWRPMEAPAMARGALLLSKVGLVPAHYRLAAPEAGAAR